MCDALGARRETNSKSPHSHLNDRFHVGHKGIVVAVKVVLGGISDRGQRRDHFLLHDDERAGQQVAELRENLIQVRRDQVLLEIVAEVDERVDGIGLQERDGEEKGCSHMLRLDGRWRINTAGQKVVMAIRSSTTHLDARVAVADTDRLKERRDDGRVEERLERNIHLARVAGSKVNRHLANGL